MFVRSYTGCVMMCLMDHRSGTLGASVNVTGTLRGVVSRALPFGPMNITAGQSGDHGDHTSTHVRWGIGRICCRVRDVVLFLFSITLTLSSFFQTGD